MKFNLQTYVGSFPKWMRPYVVKFCDIHNVRPSNKATQLAFYLAAKHVDDDDMREFCRLWEMTTNNVREAYESNEREIAAIAKSLRKIASEAKTESNV